jgi:hypothetical protein
MKTSFIGNWLVSEYLYTPSGEYVGVIHQRRQLIPKDDVIRVIQFCEPVKVTTELSENAKDTLEIMNKRVGEFIFDLKLVGKARHYLGEDVIGGGFSWRDGVLTAKGLWTRFGYNFTSFSILLNPTRQVTGGKFFIANQEVATIVGVAVPENEGYPTFGDMESASLLAEKQEQAPALQKNTKVNDFQFHLMVKKYHAVKLKQTKKLLQKKMGCVAIKNNMAHY